MITINHDSIPIVNDRDESFTIVNDRDESITIVHDCVLSHPDHIPIISRSYHDRGSIAKVGSSTVRTDVFDTSNMYWRHWRTYHNQSDDLSLWVLFRHFFVDFYRLVLYYITISSRYDHDIFTIVKIYITIVNDRDRLITIVNDRYGSITINHDVITIDTSAYPDLIPISGIFLDSSGVGRGRRFIR